MCYILVYKKNSIEHLLICQDPWYLLSFPLCFSSDPNSNNSIPWGVITHWLYLPFNPHYPSQDFITILFSLYLQVQAQLHWNSCISLKTSFLAPYFTGTIPTLVNPTFPIDTFTWAAEETGKNTQWCWLVFTLISYCKPYAALVYFLSIL